jgi:hypothetical protein
MTVNEFILDLMKLRSDLRNCEVIIQAPNGLVFKPVAKRVGSPFSQVDNDTKVLLTYE